MFMFVKQKIDYQTFIRNESLYPYVINEKSAAYRNFSNKILTGEIRLDKSFNRKRNISLIKSLIFFLIGVWLGLTQHFLFFSLSFEYILKNSMYKKGIDIFIKKEGIKIEKIFNILVANNIIYSDKLEFEFVASSHYVFKNKLDRYFVFLIIFTCAAFLFIIFDDTYINYIDNNFTSSNLILKYNNIIEHVGSLKLIKEN